jgi:hypothetical protein
MRISYLGVDVAFAPLIDESRQKACSNMSFPVRPVAPRRKSCNVGGCYNGTDRSCFLNSSDLNGDA